MTAVSQKRKGKGFIFCYYIRIMLLKEQVLQLYAFEIDCFFFLRYQRFFQGSFGNFRIGRAAWLKVIHYSSDSNLYSSYDLE